MRDRLLALIGIGASTPSHLANCSCCTAGIRPIKAAVLESEALNTAPVSVTLFDDGWLECRVLCQQLLDGVYRIASFW